MRTENKTEKYIHEYLKKHYPKRRQLKAGSAAHEILNNISSGMKDFWAAYKEFADQEWNLFPRVSVYTSVVGRKYLSRSQLTGGLSSLERGGYMQRSKDSQTVWLTEKGISEILKYRMKNIVAAPKVWDGKWRIIVFDIKESTRGDRDYLRKQLRWIGFKELQKSVWVFPYEVRNELKEFMKLCKFKFQGDVRFILADNIEPDDVMRKKFKLAQSI